MSPTIYTIAAENMPGLMVKLVKLSRKSQKLIGKDINFKILEEIRTPRTRLMGNHPVRVLDHDGNPAFDLSYNVTINADVPKIHGWTFLATIDHEPDSGNILRVSPNVDFTMPEFYRTAPPHCDHCNLKRHRKDTFLLRCDATGEVKQIGRQCIRDFIGYDVESVVAMANVVYDAIPSDDDGEGDWYGGMPTNAKYIYVPTFLAHASAVIRAYGWVSRKDAASLNRDASADEAHKNMFPPRGDTKFKPRLIVQQDLDIAAAALAWGATLSGKTDYEYNLSVVARDNFIAHRSIGLLASLISAYTRHMEEQFRRDNATLTGQHVGQSGERLKDIAAVLFDYRVLPGDMYGPRHMMKFLTAGGDVIVWYASGKTGTDLGMGSIDATNRIPVLLTGTVARHSEYQGVRETMMSRCKIKRVVS